MRWANKRGRDSQCGKHPGNSRAMASSTAALYRIIDQDTHMPHPHSAYTSLPYSSVKCSHTIHFRQLQQQQTRYTTNNLLSLPCMHSILPAQKEWMVLSEKAKIMIRLKCRSNGWVNYLGIKASKEGLQYKLWIRARVFMNVPALHFLSSCTHSSLVFAQRPPQQPPLPHLTHTSYMVATVMVTSLSTAAICVERVSMRRARRGMWLKILSLQQAQAEMDRPRQAEQSSMNWNWNIRIHFFLMK